MRRSSFSWIVGFFVLIVLFAGISPVLGETGTSNKDERPVMIWTEPASSDTAGWEAVWEYFNAVETGAVPEPAREELTLDDYHPD